MLVIAKAYIWKLRKIVVVVVRVVCFVILLLLYSINYRIYILRHASICLFSITIFTYLSYLLYIHLRLSDSLWRATRFLVQMTSSGHKIIKLRLETRLKSQASDWLKWRPGRHFSQSDAWDLSLVSNLSFMILVPHRFLKNYVKAAGPKISWRVSYNDFLLL